MSMAPPCLGSAPCSPGRRRFSRPSAGGDALEGWLAQTVLRKACWPPGRWATAKTAADSPSPRRVVGDSCSPRLLFKRYSPAIVAVRSIPQNNEASQAEEAPLRWCPSFEALCLQRDRQPRLLGGLIPLIRDACSGGFRGPGCQGLFSLPVRALPGSPYAQSPFQARQRLLCGRLGRGAQEAQSAALQLGEPSCRLAA